MVGAWWSQQSGLVGAWWSAKVNPPPALMQAANGATVQHGPRSFLVMTSNTDESQPELAILHGEVLRRQPSLATLKILQGCSADQPSGAWREIQKAQLCLCTPTHKKATSGFTSPEAQPRARPISSPHLEFIPTALHVFKCQLQLRLSLKTLWVSLWLTTGVNQKPKTNQVCQVFHSTFMLVTGKTQMRTSE